MSASHLHDLRRVVLLSFVVVAAGCGYAQPREPQIAADQANQAWHAHYQDGWAAIRVEDYDLALGALIEALRYARRFDSADRRLAETLDDLGLVYFQLGRDADAEMMQGQAVTQLLLAKGPNDPDLSVFITRLGYIYQRQGEPERIEAIQRHPYLIFEQGYTVHDRQLARRIDALIHEYERAKDDHAVEYLSAQARSIRHGAK